MKQAENPDTKARFWLENEGKNIVLKGVDDDGDPFAITLNQLLVNEMLTDMQAWQAARNG